MIILDHWDQPSTVLLTIMRGECGLGKTMIHMMIMIFNINNDYFVHTISSIILIYFFFKIRCLAVWIIHAGEASYAYYLARYDSPVNDFLFFKLHCRRANFSNKDSLLWAIQTFFLGFTSLLPLILKIRKIKRKQLQ